MIRIENGDKYYVVDITLDGVHVLDDAIPSFKDIEHANHVASLLEELNPNAKVVVSEYTWIAPVVHVYSSANEYLVPETLKKQISNTISEISNPFLRNISLANLKTLL